MAGSAIGLGNVWRFPYITGKYGGAAFVAFYLLIVLTFGLSLAVAEWSIGRAGRSDTVGSFKNLRGGFWTLPGWLSFIVPFLMLSYYSVISGWIIHYIWHSIVGLFCHIQSPDAKAVFDALVANPWLCLVLHFLNMSLLVCVTIKGVSAGIEKMCKTLMPALFLILIALVARSLTLDGAMEGVKFYLVPNFHNLTSEGMLAATSQAFFSLSVATGSGLTYGSYLDKNANMPRLAVLLVFFDTLVALLAGFVIFPACSATGITPDTGPGLAFVTLPMVFAKMPFGSIFALACFFLFFIAAFTSATSQLEVTVAFAMDQLKLSRRASTLIMALLIFMVGIPSAIGGMPGFPRVFGKTFLNASDFVVTAWLMPVTAILISIFVSWVWVKGVKDEITNNGTIPFKLYSIWLFICRFVAPLCLIILLISGGKW